MEHEREDGDFTGLIRTIKEIVVYSYFDINKFNKSVIEIFSAVMCRLSS
ncbi:MAG: hypothetical protein GTO29_13345 [Candidatus Latescibacteria bacterium]|nr:hypothetical protein [Candidatus Latescibacterota bacterium]NIO57236.1 hypothetical protein [Candidatus Latescibacterota bacterium]